MAETVVDNKKSENGKVGMVRRGWEKSRNWVAKIFKRKKDAVPQEMLQKEGLLVNQSENAQANAAAQQDTEEQHGIKFIQSMLNDLERGTRGPVDIVFSGEFNHAIRENRAYTPFENKLLSPQEQYIIKRLALKGGEYQDPAVIERVKLQRSKLIEKLNKKRDGIRELDRWDIDIIFVTLATKDEWLKRLYDEVLRFSVKTESGEPGKVIGGVLSYLTNTPTLVQKVECQGSLLPKEKTVKILSQELDEDGIKNWFKQIIISAFEKLDADPQKDADLKNKKANEVLPLMGGILTCSDENKKKELERRLIESIEVTNLASRNKKMLKEELDEDFLTYETLSNIERILEEASRLNISQSAPDKVKEKLKEASDLWYGGLQRGIDKRIQRVDTEIYPTRTAWLKQKQRPSLIDRKNNAEKAMRDLDSSKYRAELQNNMENALSKVKLLTNWLYPPIGDVREIETRLKEKDQRLISRLDLLMARSRIRDPPADIEKLKDGLAAEQEGLAGRIKRWVYKLISIKTVVNTIIAVFKLLELASGNKTIRNNWQHRYPHSMYSIKIKGKVRGLPRNIGVALNTVITRALILYGLGGLYRDTWLERMWDFLPAPLSYEYKIVKIDVRDKEGVLKVVRIDDSNRERKMRPEDIEERYGVKGDDEKEFLEEQPEVLAYLEGLTAGEIKRTSNKTNNVERINYRLEKTKADNFVKKIKESNTQQAQNKQIGYKHTKVRREWWPFNWPLTWPFGKELEVIPLEEVREKEMVYLKEGYIYPERIEKYKSEYNLPVQEAEKLTKLAEKNKDLFGLLNKGAHEWHIKDAKEFLNQYANKIDSKTKFEMVDEMPTENMPENTVYVLKKSGIVENSIDTSARIGVPYIDLSEENINYLIDMKNENRLELISGIFAMIRTEYYINKGKNDELVTFLAANITGSGIPLEEIVKVEPKENTLEITKGPQYENFVDQLKEKGIIMQKDGQSNSPNTITAQQGNQSGGRPPMGSKNQQVSLTVGAKRPTGNSGGRTANPGAFNSKAQKQVRPPKPAQPPKTVQQLKPADKPKEPAKQHSTQPAADNSKQPAENSQEKSKKDSNNNEEDDGSF